MTGEVGRLMTWMLESDSDDRGSWTLGDVNDEKFGQSVVSRVFRHRHCAISQ